MKKYLIFLCTLLCIHAQARIYDYGGQRAWTKAITTQKFRIVQIGDSHTAADFFTDSLRQRLQKHYGNGGIGWVYPAHVAGQREALVQYSDAKGWNVITSRLGQSDHFPFGGITAMTYPGQMGTIQARQTNKQKQNITFSIYPLIANDKLTLVDGHNNTQFIPFDYHKRQWQFVTVQGYLPIEIRSNGTDYVELGLVNFENQNKKGVVLSALGINGAQFTDMSKWRPGWLTDLQQMKPNLIIFSFGTNESLNTRIDIQKVESQWNSTIQTIKKHFPRTGILILGASESLAKQKGRCGTRTPELGLIQKMQLRVAKRNKVMYWSWQRAMGGRCTMKHWIRKGWGRRDGVHFTAPGYDKLAAILAHDLIRKIGH